MANRKITVLNPTGYQELFQSGDVLVLDGSVDLQSTGITGIPDPTQNLDCSNKKYVDDTKALLDSDIATINTNITNLTNSIGNGTISFSASQNMTVSGSLTTNQAGNSTITLTGPDLTNLLPKPSADGVYVVNKTGVNVTYVEVIDGGSY